MKKMVGMAGIIMALALSSAQGAVIGWGAATRVSADTDVSTNGDAEYGYTFSGGNKTINGVFFRNSGYNLNFYGQGNITSTDFTAINNSVFRGSGTVLAPANTLSTPYFNLLGGAIYGNSTKTSSTITLNKLTATQEYEVQIWLHDGRNLAADDTGNKGLTIASGANSVDLDYNNADTTGGANGDNNGGVGQFVIGTFTADATTQDFTLTIPGTQSGGLQLNAIQLRAIPEPATMGLVVLFGGSILFIRRRFML